MNQRQWTEEEDNYLKNNFGKLNFSELAKNFGYAIKIVQTRAEILGIEFERGKQIRWTEEVQKFILLCKSKKISELVQ